MVPAPTSFDTTDEPRGAVDTATDAAESSDSDTSSIEPIIQYATESPSSDLSAAPLSGEGHTTRKGRDYRPPSTFLRKPRKSMTLAERICALAKAPEELHFIKTVDRGPMPSQSLLRENFFILSRAVVPLLIQAASHWAFPNYRWHAAIAYVFYFASFQLFALAVLARFNHFAVVLGTFDEKNFGRDRTPDTSVNGLARGITAYMLFRTGLCFYFYYDKTSSPLSFSLSYPLRLIAWELALDYFFYCYHRASHDVPALWHIHKEHHSTRHPTAILATLAGDYQEVIEIMMLPLLVTSLVPMSFGELWLTLCITIYVETLGHSGVRSDWKHPILWFLRVIDCEGAIEDHDLHHRNGKGGKNFGKQSRLFDQLFGTVGSRIETAGMRAGDVRR